MYCERNLDKRVCAIYTKMEQKTKKILKNAEKYGMIHIK